MADELAIRISTVIDTVKSIAQINADILKMEAKIAKLKVIATLNKSASKAQLDADIANLKNKLDSVKINAKLNPTKSKQQINANLKQLQSDIDSVELKVKVDNSKVKQSLNNVVDAANKSNISSPIKSADNHLSTFNERLKTTISRFLEWKSIATAVNYVIQLFRSAIDDLKTIDTLLTEISKTSDMTISQIKQVGADSFDTASKYGESAQNYLEAVKEMSRAGFEESSTSLAELSLMAQSAGDLTSDLANEYLIATNAAYQFGGDVQKLTEVLDGQNTVTNRNAVDMQKLASAIKAVASQAANSGVSIQQLTAAIGTISAVTQQAGETTGRAFRTILMNLQQVKGETEDGEIIDEESLTKAEKACADLGVSLKTVKDGIVSLRNPMDILRDLAEVYSTLDESDARRANLLSSVAGKNRSNQLSALLSNWQMYEKMLNDYADSAGSAMEEAQKTADSWEGRLNSLGNTWTKYVSNLVDTELVKGAITGIDEVISGFDRLNQSIGAIPPLLTTVTAALTVFDKKYGITQLFNGKTGKLDVQGNFLGVDFTAIKKQKKYFADAENAIKQWNTALSAGTADITTFNNRTAQTNESLRNYLQNTTDGSASLKGYKSALNAAGISTDALRIKTVLLNSVIALGIGLFIQFAASAVSYAINHVEDAANAAGDAAAEVQKVNSNLQSYINEYNSLGDKANWNTSDTETAKNLNTEILDLLKNQGAEMDSLLAQLDLANGKYAEQKRILTDISLQQAKQDRGTYSNNVASQGNLLTSKKNNVFYNNTKFAYATSQGGIDKQMSKYLDAQGYGTNYTNSNGSGSFNFGSYDLSNADEVLRYYDNLNSAVNALAAAYEPAIIAQSAFYQKLKDERDSLQQSANAYRDAVDAYQDNEAIIEVGEALKNVTVDTKESYDSFVSGLFDSSDGISDYEQKLLDVAANTFPEFSSAAQDAGDALVSAGVSAKEAASSFGETISSIQDKMDVLDSAANELATAGGIGVDTFNKLIDNNLLQYLTATANGFEVNKTALLNEGEAARIAAVQQLQTAYAADVLALATNGVVSETSPAAAVLNAEATAASNAGAASAAAAPGVFSLASAMAILNEADAGAMTDDLTGKIQTLNGVYNGILNTINAVTIDTQKYSDAASKAGKSAGSASKGVDELTDSLDKQKEALEQAKESLEKESNRLKIYGKAAIKEIENRIDALNKEKDAATDNIDSQIDGLDAQIDKLKELKEQQEKVYDAQIEALKEKKDALDKANDAEDRAIKLAELQEALEKAKNQRTSRVYTHQSGFTWQNDENAVQDAQNALDDQQRTWAREDAIQAIEDEIDAIEKLKDALDEETQNQIDNLQKQIDALENNKDLVEANFDAQIDKLEELKDQYNDTMSLIGTSLEDYQLQLEAAAMFSGMSYDAMSGYLTSYKDSVLENMTAIADVESQLTDVENQLTAANEALNGSLSGSGGSGGGVAGGLNSALIDYKSRLDELKQQIIEVGNNTNELRDKEAMLKDSIENGNLSLFDKRDAMSELDLVQAQIAANEENLTLLTQQYTEAVMSETDITDEERQKQIEILMNLMDEYQVNYDIIAQTLQTYLENLDITTVTSEEDFNRISTAVQQFDESARTHFDNTKGAMDGVQTNFAENAKGIISSLNDVIRKLEELSEKAASAKFAAEEAAKLSVNTGSGNVVGSHAIGTRYVQKSGIHRVDEEGPEVILHKPESGRYQYLERGGVVFPAYATKNLWEAGTQPGKYIDRNLQNMSKYVYPSAPSNNETIYQTIGDINIQQPVGDVNSLARAIQRDFPNVAMKELNKR